MQHPGEGQHFSGHGVLEGSFVETPRFGGSRGPAEDAFTKLLANFEAQELPATLHQSPTLTPFRRQRKSCRPLRIPPTSETSPSFQLHKQKGPLEGASLIEQQYAASFEADKSGSFVQTQDRSKPKPLSPTSKSSPHMDKVLQNMMRLDCPLPTSLHENGWDHRNEQTSATRSTLTNNKFLNRVVTHATGGLSSQPNLHQNVNKLDPLCSNVCRNNACQAEIASEASFCRCCSCCICKLFDNKRDPSLWISCDPNVGSGCGLSCHIECALKQQVAGVVVNPDGSIPSLDGSYYCHSCQAITQLLGCWREQLLVAKAALTLDILHHRLLLSYRLLKGTKLYKEAHYPVEEAMKRLDAEVRQICSVKLLQCSVDVLPCKTDVQRLISSALEKADTQHLASIGAAKQAGHSMVPFMVCFEDVSSSSIVVAVTVRGTFVKLKPVGYKLWHRRASEPVYACAPTSVLFNMNEKFVVSNLHPLTDYTFKVVPFSMDGDLAACEAGCSTKGVENVEPSVDVYASLGVLLINTEGVKGETSRCMNQGFNPNYSLDKRKNGLTIQDLDEVLVEQNEQGLLKSAKPPGKEQKDNHESFEGSVPVYPKRVAAERDERTEHLAPRYMAGVQEGRNRHLLDTSETKQMLTGVTNSSMKMSLHVSTDCWEDKLSRKRHRTATEQDLCSDRCHHAMSFNQLHPPKGKASTSKVLKGNVPSQSLLMQGDESDKAAIATGIQTEKELVPRLGDCMQGVFSCNSEADFNKYEFSVKVIRWLECKGHLKEEFRMKFLTWFTLRASDQEKRVISVFIDTLQDDPASLAGQLVDAFEEMIGIDRHPSMLDGFCRRLW